MVEKNLNEKPEQFFKDISIEFLIHELKDPISIIETDARTLLEKQARFGKLVPRQEKTLKRIVRNAQKARDMLYSMLEVGRSESESFICSAFAPDTVSYRVLLNCLEIQAPPIAEALQDVSDKLQEMDFLAQQGIHFQVKPSATGLEMLQDEAKYQQVLSNLIKNALHFRQKRLDIILDCQDRRLLVDVIDDGPGIPPEHQQNIFLRYMQIKECTLTARSGHGLGLAGARIIARCLGGDITIISNPDQGTTFRLTLPTKLNS